MSGISLQAPEKSLETAASNRWRSLNWLRQQFEVSRGQDGANVRTMEGLRGFAVLLVFFVHFVTMGLPLVFDHDPTRGLADAVRIMGNSGVDLFFLLSGYLIYGSLIRRKQPFWQFMSRRLKRIYPAFIAVFALYVVLSWAFPSQSKIPGPAIEGAIYLAANFLLLPGILPIKPMITVAWSLSYEMFFYVTIPIGIELFGLRKRTPRTRMLLFLAMALGLSAYCAVNGGHLRLIMFTSGVMLYEAIQSVGIRSPGAQLGMTCLVIGLISTLIPKDGSEWLAVKVGIQSCAFFVLCLVCFQEPKCWLARVFTWTPLRWLGNMSYSYYLLHGLALKVAFMAFSTLLPERQISSWIMWSSLPCMFGLTLIPTSALFLAIERPFSLVVGKPVNQDRRQ